MGARGCGRERAEVEAEETTLQDFFCSHNNERTRVHGWEGRRTPLFLYQRSLLACCASRLVPRASTSADRTRQDRDGSMYARIEMVSAREDGPCDST
jgi:hypothetical protein